MAEFKITLSKADMLRIATVAKEYGVIVEYVDGDTTIRIEPHHGAEPVKPSDRANQVDAILSRGRRGNPVPPITPDLNWREADVMLQLSRYPIGQKVHWRTLANFGPATQKKLEDRGYIDVSYEAEKPDVLNEVWLTKSGMKAWNSLRSYYDKYPSL
ncbi:hypothetical protein AB3480_06415 [Rhizobium mongolense]|uniref:hypothetical protein n=1 Tax=Rhizobium mongolense TaxID=57676 RepID=UPI0034A241E3